MTKRTLAAAACVAGAVTIAVAAPSYATVVETTTYYYTPAPVTTYYYYTPPSTTYYTPPLTSYHEPTIIEVRTEPAITVEAPALTEDQAITSDVADRLASNPYLSGRIGVETRDNDVTLSGTVSTPGQVRRAVNDTKGVPGVRGVNNELRSRVGGSSY